MSEEKKSNPYKVLDGWERAGEFKPPADAVVHDLKIQEHFLKAKIRGDKPFEIRNDSDRGFQKGDYTCYTDTTTSIPHIKHWYQITYVCRYMQIENYVVFGERKVS